MNESLKFYLFMLVSSKEEKKQFPIKTNPPYFQSHLVQYFLATYSQFVLAHQDRIPPLKTIQ